MEEDSWEQAERAIVGLPSLHFDPTGDVCALKPEERWDVSLVTPISNLHEVTQEHDISPRL